MAHDILAHPGLGTSAVLILPLGVRIALKNGCTTSIKVQGVGFSVFCDCIQLYHRVGNHSETRGVFP